VHLDDPALESFLNGLFNSTTQRKMLLLSNSVDYDSSLRNLELSSRCESILPFVGVHPEVFAKNDVNRDKEWVDSSVEKITGLLPKAKGIGEIGLDPKYSSLEIQFYLLEKILGLAERFELPLSIHNRQTVSKLLEIISTYKIRGRILFHWFAGTEEELKNLHDRGIYTSFGPSILFSRRLARLVEISNPDYLLSETDAPTRFESLTAGYGTPYLLTSVVFKMHLILKRSFGDIETMLQKNSYIYSGTQS
jgi:TatD DNase family protein